MLAEDVQQGMMELRVCILGRSSLCNIIECVSVYDVCGSVGQSNPGDCDPWSMSARIGQVGHECVCSCLDNQTIKDVSASVGM